MQQSYQVIILAGGQGSELYPLCEKFPKSLLPINNKPLIIYQLEKIESSGFTCALILTSKNSGKMIERYLKESYHGLVKYELIITPEEKKETVDALKYAANKITKNFILIASDSISDLSLDDITEKHMLSGSFVTMVLKEDRVDEENNKIINPSSLTDNHDVFLINESNSKVLYVQQYLEIKESGLKVKKSILASNPEASIRTNLFDSHIYICKRGVLSLLCGLEKKVSDEIASWKDDFIPFLVRNQQNVNLLEAWGKTNKKEGDEDEFEVKKINEEPIESIPLFACITSKNYIKRTSCIKDYFQANFDCIKTDKQMSESFVNTFQNNNVPLLTSFDADVKINQSNIGEKAQISSKAQITKSIVGQNCKIGEGVKISNSIIMRDVVIESGCILQNCIVSSKATVKLGCELKECWIGMNGLVEPNTQLSGEVIIQYDN